MKIEEEVMAPMELCSELWGAAHVIQRDPGYEIHQNVFCIPIGCSDPWGIYDQGGRIIRSATDYRENNFSSHGQSLDHVISAPVQSRAHGVFIYGGKISNHYGHFLVNTLPRFWNILKIRTPNTPILCHGAGSPSDWFNIPFLAQSFAALGLSERDFVVFDAPTVVDTLVVPRTSFQEQYAGHVVYGQLCREISDRICPHASLINDDRPIYYSKSQLVSAVGVIVNEGEIDDVMRSEGVDIIYPERLSFPDQIKLMGSRRNIMGSSGSFLHTSLFCPDRNITCLNVALQINSNFSIIDKLSDNFATYHYSSEIQVLEKKEGFLTARYLPNARECAYELLAIMKAKI
ncbi:MULTISPECIES: glycosyltransferase family 61 protein [Methylobacterium]|jgi:capsular polysaccharide biosynthesis protein|uniref:Glycosyltransferase family 61 protein n=1 Tax=Methylobacterium ajmalii TaxID=2738439 RepID=A0ABU9ZUN3_9HYPH|nr:MULTISPECIES: glycosyltransferase family 61 protein [Methylobacterium]MBK3397060.1 glycosyltransferase family 61 protein [Methylobacterium ajmalii]MBK3410446.1 glycosyltransferase family 61 protein [Methylobacterium ajmalii]MBK3422391.1 glycosyltransferase family 61 protein [Methylobacterium ajmalii]MBZ6412221.1 glycosyltransferase family 61 protein [Methylobacterium sp.]